MDLPKSHRLHPGYSHPLLREWHDNSRIEVSHLMYPIFVTDQVETQTEIKSLPEQFHLSPDSKLENFMSPLVKKGLRSVIIFGVLMNTEKDSKARCAFESSPVVKAITLLRRVFPHLLVAVDVCLCGYTDHGHCGILDHEGKINNTKSCETIAELAVSYAKAGAHIVAPSDMMDGRVAAIKDLLSKHELEQVAVMSYSSKFASCFYGPFREAAHSAPSKGDRKAYQLPPPATGLALRAVERDVEEGADFVMVKPAGPYLDIIHQVKQHVRVPVACYHVSGEYAMLWHAAAVGAFDLKTAVIETLKGFRRAGVDIIITYFTPQMLDWLQGHSV